MAVITQEAVAAVKARGNAMGFAINELIAGSLAEAAIQAQFGPEFQIDDDKFQIYRLRETVNNLQGSVVQMGKWLTTNAPALEEIMEERQASRVVPVEPSNDPA